MNVNSPSMGWKSDTLSPKRSALIGAARTPFVREEKRSVVELVQSAVSGALQSAKISHDKVDYIITVSVDLFDGKTASNIAITEVVGAIMKGETRVAADGLVAAFHADSVLRAGQYKTVLVVAHCKPSEIGDLAAVTRFTFDPVYLQPLGIDHHSLSLLRRSLLEEKVIHRSGENVLDGLATCDGAAAIVLSSDPKRIPHSNPSVSILSAAIVSDAHYPGRRDFSGKIFEDALRRALQEGGLSGMGSIDCAMVMVDQEWERGRYEKLMRNHGFGGPFVGATPAPFLVQGLSGLIDVFEKNQCHHDRKQSQRWLLHSRNGVAGQAEMLMVVEVGCGH